MKENHLKMIASFIAIYLGDSDGLFNIMETGFPEVGLQKKNDLIVAAKQFQKNRL